MGRIILSALVGGVVLFAWGWLSWTVLPWNDARAKPLPNENIITATLTAGITEKGVYLFPVHPTDWNDKQAMDAYAQRYEAGPIGMITYNPQGESASMTRELVTEAVLCVLSALIASALLSAAAGGCGGYVGRVVFVALIGIFVALSTSAEGWNWFKTPESFTVISIADQVIRATLLGIVLAAIIRPKRQATPTA